jgi:UPF0716 family protein affecting phage T7 exclusion
MERQPPRTRSARLARLTLGWAMTIGGLILGPVPIVPGFVLLIPGLALLAAESRFIRGQLRRLREKRLMRRAMREAERVGIRIDLGQDGDEDDPPPPGPGTGNPV